MHRTLVPVHPQENESGLGLCLRALARSRLSLNWMRHELKLNPRRMPHDEQISALASLLDVDEGFMRDRTLRQQRAGGSHWICGSHRGLFSNQIRVSWPQVCPRCVHQEGYCRWQWDFALITWCPFHECELVDRCGVCEQPLRWDRPQLDVCCCKHPLTGGRAVLTPELRLVHVLVESMLYGANPANLLSASGLPVWIGELTIAGLTTLLQAFGDQQTAFCSPKASTWARSRCASYWQDVASRGLHRLQAFGRGDDLEPLINAALLRRLARDGVAPTDRAIGNALLRAIGANAQIEQLELFGHGGLT